MPLYEYKCLDCGNKFDLLRSYKDADEPIDCQVCKSNNTSRSISRFFAQSGGRIIASDSSHSCSACSGGSCANCNR